nr:hypothetical protein GCM10020185_17030 [Pseudomonas brassicacearum subsp. brassicacearum]
MVEWCVRRRKTVIILTVLLFVGSVVLFRFVPQQFFPASGRLELMVDLKLQEGASLSNTAEQVKRLEALLKDHVGIDNYVAYVGTGSPRFYLPLDQQLPASSFAQFVVLAKTIEDREPLRSWLISTLNEQFPTLRSRVTRLEKRPSSRLPGAVPRHGRTHRKGSRPGAQSGGESSRKPLRDQCAPGLGRAEQGGVPERRPGPRPSPGREHGQPGEFPAQLPHWLQRQSVSGRQRADRNPAAWHGA